jgi:hypothetical protein
MPPPRFPPAPFTNGDAFFAPNGLPDAFFAGAFFTVLLDFPLPFLNGNAMVLASLIVENVNE